jgi:Ca2+-binding RTX toxin-like protein
VIDGSTGTNIIAGTAYLDILDFSATTLVNIAKIDGGAGDDTITGSAGNDVILGGAGRDTLSGGAGDDFLDGGSGADSLAGGLGNDTYVVNTSNDEITENSNEGIDTVQSIASYTLAANVENLTLTGTGNTIATGNSLDNVLTGNSGINTLNGNAGNDTLSGGAGDDILKGGTGDDRYRFDTGWGADTLIENDATAGNTDTVAFGAGINFLDLVFTQNGSNLVINRHGSADSVTVQNWYGGSACQTEVFQAADGSTLLNTRVDQLIQAMAQFSATHGGVTWDQAIDQNPNEVEAVISAYWQPAA